MANGQNQVLRLKTLDEPNKKIYIFFGIKTSATPNQTISVDFDISQNWTQFAQSTRILSDIHRIRPVQHFNAYTSLTRAKG